MSINQNVPTVSQPVADLAALAMTTVQLRQGMLSLAGRSGGPLDRAVTLHDLVALGLVTAADITAKLK